MPIIVTYVNPNMRPDVIEGESWKKLDESSPRTGTINLKSLTDGHRIIVNKSAVAKVEEIPQATWDMNVEAQKKQQQDQLKAQADEKEKARLGAEEKKKAAAAATLALLEAKTFRGRVKRLLGRKP
jgi:hypothetical protein